MDSNTDGRSIGGSGAYRLRHGGVRNGAYPDGESGKCGKHIRSSGGDKG